MDQNQFQIDLLRNPLNIQSNVLKELENRLLGGEKITDANNVVMFLIEMMSTLTADGVNDMANTFPTLYPKRAQTSTDLFKHMSTWDYLNLFSTPATCELSIFFDKDYLIKYAQEFNVNYKKVVIPKDTIITIADYKFGLHYPIEIRINKSSNTFLVSYDTTETNPLLALKQNTIEHRISKYAGLNLISINVPIYQFEKKTVIEDLQPNIGFSKTYEHTDRFYAVRIFNYINNQWEEIQQTLSDDVYDPQEVTAKLHILSDIQKVQITIPQIYFSKNKMGDRLKIELYTTKGEIDADITGLQPEAISINFVMSGDPNKDKYSTILEKIPTIGASPTSNKIQGGGNGYDFNELRNRVVNDTFYGNVLITSDELTKYFEDVGFLVHRYRDGITDRIYHCYKEVTDKNGAIISSADLTTVLTQANIDACSTIVRGDDGSIVILPTTLFKYTLSDNSVYPLSDTEVQVINGLSKAEIVKEFNENIYTLSPFHIRVELNDQYPYANTYDLTKPTVDRIEFLGENVNVSTQIVMFNATVRHLNMGTAGYDIDMYIEKSDDLENIDVSKLAVFARTQSAANQNIWIEANYIGEVDKRLVFRIHIDTTYAINREHQLKVTSFHDDANLSDHYINLVTDLDVVFLVHESVFSNPVNNNGFAGIIPSQYSDYIPVTEQLLRVTFGNLVTEVANETNVVYSDLQYEVYDVDQPATYASDIYRRDPDGVPIYSINGNDLILELEHKQGEYQFSVPKFLLGNTTENSDIIDIVNVDTSNITSGSTITGPGLPSGTTVTGADSEQVQIDQLAEYNVECAIYEADGIKFIGKIDANTNVIHVLNTDLNEIETGMKLNADTIPLNNEIIGVDVPNNQIQIKYAATADGTSVVIKTGQVMYTHKAGDPILNEYGEPTVIKNREIMYYVNMIHVDAKLSKTETSEYQDYIEILSDNLRSYFNTISAAKDQLIEETKLYFKPLRTIGTAMFKLSNVAKRRLNLELTIKLRVYVKQYVMESKDMLDTVKSKILDILDEHMKSDTVSCTVISELIRNQMPESVSYVDVLGINDEISLQTIIADEVGTRACLKRYLVLSDSNIIDSERGLEVEFLPV